MTQATVRTLLVLAISAIALDSALAQIPRTISFQGVLADAAGTIVPDGPQQITVTIYDQQTGGSTLFSEVHTVNVVRGVFNAIIGSSTPSGIPTTVAFDNPYWLGVKIGTGVEIAPRTPFTSVPYSLNAAVAQSAVRASYADTSGHATFADSAANLRGGYVASLNGVQGQVEVLGAGATTVTRNGNQFIIRSTDTSGGGIRRIDNFDGSLVIDPPQGPFVTMFIREGGVQTHHYRDLSITTAKIMDQQITTRTIANGAVTNEKLGALSISNDKIQTGAVDSRTILNGTIITEDLADNSVTSPKIVDGQVLTQDIGDLQVTNAKLAADAVTTDKIMDGQVQTADIADGAVTNPKLAADAVTTDKIMDGQVQTADIADLNVTNAKLAPNSVTTDKIVNGTIITEDLADNSVTSAKIVDGTIVTADLADNSVTSPKIVDGQVMTADIADLNVTNAKLAANSVTTDKIQDATIITADLADNSVTSAKIVDGQVMTADIADGNVTLPKISSAGAAANQSIMYDGANVIWGNPAASSLVMPFSQTANVATTMFSLTNTNGTGNVSNFTSNGTTTTSTFTNNSTGSAGSFATPNAGNASPALSATTSGTGDAIHAVRGAAAAGPGLVAAIHGESAADIAMYAESNGNHGLYSYSNANHSIFAISNGVNMAGVFGRGDNNFASGVWGQGIGSFAVGVRGTSQAGRAGLFELIAGNSNVALDVTTAGTGIAGQFNVTNPASMATVVSATTAGGGTGVHASATSGIGVLAQATTGTAIVATSVAGPGIAIVGGTSQVGLRVLNGRTVLAYAVVPAASIAPLDKTVLLVNETAPGSDAVQASITLPAAGFEDGSIVIVSTNDADGGLVSYNDFDGATTFSFSRGSTVRFVQTGGVWVAEF